MCFKIASRPSTASPRADAPERRRKPLLQKAPIDRRGELRQRMTHVDDLIEPSPKQILPPAVPPLLRRIANLPSSTSTRGENHSAAQGSICKKTAPNTQQTCENDYFSLAETAAMSESSGFFADDYFALRSRPRQHARAQGGILFKQA
jgi:hypothetical protein